MEAKLKIEFTILKNHGLQMNVISQCDSITSDKKKLTYYCAETGMIVESGLAPKLDDFTINIKGSKRFCSDAESNKPVTIFFETDFRRDEYLLTVKKTLTLFSLNNYFQMERRPCFTENEKITLEF